MKKNFIFIAILAGLASIASAASKSDDNAIYVLPTYVVTAPRTLPAEQKVSDRLHELRSEARTQVTGVPSPGAPKVGVALHARATKGTLAKVMAKY